MSDWNNEVAEEKERLRAKTLRTLEAENAALKAAAKGDAWRLLDIANREIVNLKDEIEEYAHIANLQWARMDKTGEEDE